jgi:hypothetical protein
MIFNNRTVDAIRLTGAIIMILVAFLFVGLNVSRLKLSRDLLDTYLLKSQRYNRRLTHSELPSHLVTLQRMSSSSLYVI